jgi:hypothetical protein
VKSLLMASLAAIPAMAAIGEPPGLGPAIRAPADEEPAFMLTATGAQVYECRQATAVAGTYSWYPGDPDATLYEGSRRMGLHKGANLWESAGDRSSVSGTVRASQTYGAGNLPWTLYRGQAAEVNGLFAGVTSIQRVNTSGGAAPTTGCDASHDGAQARVNFSAQYFFYRRRAG